ncbi:MAG TPA: DUF4192 domain-containing protein [Microlunatus sp.]|nr:DUF4192 domain-containing protein [Microlunatus sp.]
MKRTHPNPFPDRSRATASRDVEPSPSLRVRSPADLLGIVPYLLGFHPLESVVAVLLGERQIVLTARMDAVELEHPTELAGYLEDLRRQQAASRVVLITYSAEAGARERTAALAEAFDPVVLADALIADEGRWWSVLCPAGCCPADGTPYDPVAHPLGAAAVYAGLIALPDRAALEAMVCGPAPEDLSRFSVLADAAVAECAALSLSRRRRWIRSLVAEGLRDQSPDAELVDRDCARMAALVTDIAVRDVAWTQLRRDRAPDHVALWHRVVSRTPPELAAAPLCLLGMAAWVSGNGALQNCCVGRVLSIDPDYSMAHLLADINERALPPRCWDELLQEFRRNPQLLAG